MENNAPKYHLIKLKRIHKGKPHKGRIPRKLKPRFRKQKKWLSIFIPIAGIACIAVIMMCLVCSIKKNKELKNKQTDDVKA